MLSPTYQLGGRYDYQKFYQKMMKSSGLGRLAKPLQSACASFKRPVGGEFCLLDVWDLRHLIRNPLGTLKPKEQASKCREGSNFNSPCFFDCLAVEDIVHFLLADLFMVPLDLTKRLYSRPTSWSAFLKLYMLALGLGTCYFSQNYHERELRQGQPSSSMAGTC